METDAQSNHKSGEKWVTQIHKPQEEKETEFIITLSTATSTKSFDNSMV